MSGQVP